MSSIKITNLSFRYEDASNNLFNHLNLALDSSWQLGLVGRNGRGKTTFLNLLQHKLHGLGKIQTKLTFAYFPLAINHPDNITLYELQAQLDFEQWELERELTLMNVDPKLLWQPFKTLSGGEQTKILLALSFTDQASFPLIDEPTNHLDEDSRQQVAKYLQRHEQGYIVVSHDRDFLNQVTDHILAIENTEIHLYQGNYAAYEDTKNKRDEFNQAKNAKLKAEISAFNQSRVRIQGFSKRAESKKNAKNYKQRQLVTNLDKGFLGHKAAKIMQRSKNIERRMDKAINAKQGLMTNIEAMPALSINFQPSYHRTLLTTQNLSLQIQTKQLFKNLNLQLKNQGIVSLAGKNGSGKTTLLKLLLGQANDVTYTGKFELANGLKISYLPQAFTDYTGTLKEFAEQQKISYEALLNNLKKMGLPRESFSTKIEEMNMGQQKRVALAKALAEPANLYLWDEPANYLDVFNQDQLIKLLKKQQPAMLLIEHDPYFIEKVANTRIKL